jgi:putative colanic acid biosynthesis acetyltransferase WcaF
MLGLSFGGLEIETNAVVSHRSYLCAASHDYTQQDFPIYAKKICIGAQAWVIIAPSMTFGEGAMVGLGALFLMTFYQNTS